MFTSNLIVSNIKRKTVIREYSFQKVSSWYKNWWYSKTEPPYSHIVQIGDPVLRNKSENVPENLINSKETSNLIDHLQHVLRKYKAVGISAPQIGIPWRIFVMELTSENLKTFSKEELEVRQVEPINFTVFINPTLKILDYQKVIFSEACESVRGFSADVSRYRQVECIGLNQNGEKITLSAHGWTARIIQHEMDHLDGKLYTDSMDRKSLTCICWHAVNVHSGRVKLPYSP